MNRSVDDPDTYPDADAEDARDQDPDADRRDRDRDADGRARNSRPRDGLGRPLPYGVAGVERAPEGVRRTVDETLAEAQRLLDAGRPFHAHEVFEDAWKFAQQDEPGPGRELWRGMAQLAVGLTHAARGNQRGAASLLRRGADVIAPFGAGVSAPSAADVSVPSAAGVSASSGADVIEPSGVDARVDVAAVVSWARAAADDAEAGRPVPPPPVLQR